jgi:hypothetical protein
MVKYWAMRPSQDGGKEIHFSVAHSFLIKIENVKGEGMDHSTDTLVFPGSLQL